MINLASKRALTWEEDNGTVRSQMVSDSTASVTSLPQATLKRGQSVTSAMSCLTPVIWRGEPAIQKKLLHSNAEARVQSEVGARKRAIQSVARGNIPRILSHANDVVVMEDVGGVSIRSIVEYNSISDRQLYLRASLSEWVWSIQRVLRELWTNGWAHGDLQPGNIHLHFDCADVSILDFELSGPFGSTLSGIWQEGAMNDEFTRSCDHDFFSLAVSLCLLVTGKSPWSDSDKSTNFARRETVIHKHDFEFVFPSQLYDSVRIFQWFDSALRTRQQRPHEELANSLCVLSELFAPTVGKPRKMSITRESLDRCCAQLVRWVPTSTAHTIPLNNDDESRVIEIVSRQKLRRHGPLTEVQRLDAIGRAVAAAWFGSERLLPAELWLQRADDQKLASAVLRFLSHHEDCFPSVNAGVSHLNELIDDRKGAESSSLPEQIPESSSEDTSDRTAIDVEIAAPNNTNEHLDKFDSVPPYAPKASFTTLAGLVLVVLLVVVVAGVAAIQSPPPPTTSPGPEVRWLSGGDSSLQYAGPFPLLSASTEPIERWEAKASAYCSTLSPGSRVMSAHEWRRLAVALSSGRIRLQGASTVEPRESLRPGELSELNLSFYSERVFVTEGQAPNRIFFIDLDPTTLNETNASGRMAIENNTQRSSAPYKFWCIRDER